MQEAYDVFGRQRLTPDTNLKRWFQDIHAEVAGSPDAMHALFILMAPNLKEVSIASDSEYQVRAFEIALRRSNGYLRLTSLNVVCGPIPTSRPVGWLREMDGISALAHRPIEVTLIC